MVMETLQIRLSKGLLDRVDGLVDAGIYANRSDAIRDGVRRLVLEEITGIIPDKGDSVKQVRALRKKLSAEDLSVEKLNALADKFEGRAGTKKR